MFLFCFALILISYRIGTHQSNANIDRVCRGPSEQARPPGPAPQAFCREQIGKLPRRACALPVPPFPAAARAPGVGGTAFQPTACLPQLTSPRSGGQRGLWCQVSVPAPVFPSSGEPPATAERLQPASQSHSHGQGSLLLQPVAPDRCKARRSPTSACQDCKWQG